MGISASYFSEQLSFTQSTDKGKVVLRVRKKTQQNRENNSTIKRKKLNKLRKKLDKIRKKLNKVRKKTQQTKEKTQQMRKT